MIVVMVVTVVGTPFVATVLAGHLMVALMVFVNANADAACHLSKCSFAAC